MNPIHSQKTLSTFIRKRLIIITELSIVLCFLFIATISLHNFYQNKLISTVQIAQTLATSASSPDGINQVSEQVANLLNDDPSLENIIFYSMDHGVNDVNYYGSLSEILTLDNLNIYRPVLIKGFSSFDPTTHYSDYSDENADQIVPKSHKAMVGYISITLNLKILRQQWLEQNINLFFFILLINFLMLYAFNKSMTKPIAQLKELTHLAKQIQDNPNLTQFPVLTQEMEFIENQTIQQAILGLFGQLTETQKKYLDLAEYEKKLKGKDQSLDLQISSFQSMITHELKTSLNAIFGGLQLLSNQYLNQEQQDAIEIIRKGSQQLSFSLEQIIQLNRIDKGQLAVDITKFQPLQLLSDLIHEFEPIAKEKNLQFHHNIIHIDPMLEGDKHKIRQILESLLDNAIKFTKEGKITLESDLQHFDNSTRWIVRIKDTGIGIEEQHIEDIFSPFFQIDPSINREYEGIGIGLAVAKRLSQLIDTKLEVESQIGKGSCFTLTVQLQNWQQVRDKNLLKDVQILFYSLQEHPTVENLQHFGAKIQTIQDVHGVDNAIAKSFYHLLLISPEIPERSIKQLAQNIRQNEKEYRVIISQLYQTGKLSDVDFGDLNASGVDFFQNINISTKELAVLIKKWLDN